MILILTVRSRFLILGPFLGKGPKLNDPNAAYTSAACCGLFDWMGIKKPEAVRFVRITHNLQKPRQYYRYGGCNTRENLSSQLSVFINIWALVQRGGDDSSPGAAMVLKQGAEDMKRRGIAHSRGAHALKIHPDYEDGAHSQDRPVSSSSQECHTLDLYTRTQLQQAPAQLPLSDTTRAKPP